MLLFLFLPTCLLKGRYRNILKSGVIHKATPLFNISTAFSLPADFFMQTIPYSDVHPSPEQARRLPSFVHV